MHRRGLSLRRGAAMAAVVGVMVATATNPVGAIPSHSGLVDRQRTSLALTPTTVRGFPVATAYVAAGTSWSPSATISGGSRSVTLQRKAGSVWSTVAVKGSTSAGVVRFSVKMPAAGQFSYRMVVPRRGLMATVTTKVQAVVVVIKKTVPGQVIGTFSGFQTSPNLPLGKWLTWHGSATFTRVRNRTWGIAGPYAPYVGPSAEYSLTQLSADWAIELTETYVDGGSCHYHGSGHLGIADALHNYLDHIDGRNVKADLSFDPWGDKHSGIKPGEYRLSIAAGTALQYDRDCSYPATMFDPAYTTHDTFYVADGLTLVSHDRTKRISANGIAFAGTQVQGRDGSLPPSNPDSENSWTWKLTGQRSIPVVHIPCSVAGC